MSDSSEKPRLIIVRRVGEGPGGAAKTLRRFESLFADEWTTEILSAGGADGRVSGTRGPSWWRNLRFAQTANAELPDARADLVFTLERGVRADLYRTADGIHARWLEIAYQNPLKRLANPLHWILPRLERNTFHAARRIVCIGRVIANDVRRFYPECANKIRIIPIGVDHARYYPHPDGRAAAKKALKIPTNQRLFVFVGTGWKIKNLCSALETFSEYRCHGDTDARLLVIGKGKPSRYHRLIQKLGLTQHVEFLGVISNVADYLRSADAMLMPSLYESFGNAGIEAIACGCPLVTNETVGACELVDSGRTGLVHPLGFDPKDAGLALHNLMKSSPSPVEVAAVATERTVENEKRMYLDLFREILAEKNAAR